MPTQPHSGQVSGTGLFQVTHTPNAASTEPSPSPDGHWIVYMVIHHGDLDHGRLFKIRPNGSGKTELEQTCTGDCQGDGFPDWSNTGLIAFQRTLSPSPTAPTGFHAIAVEARAPRFEGGIVTRVDSIPFGIVVNRDGRRFHDEGEDLWPKRYAAWGQLIARQPEQVACSIYDAKVAGDFIPSAYPPHSAATLGELATGLGLEPAALEGTVAEFNRHVHPGDYDRSRLDGCGTDGLVPAKSHWALPIDTPPFYGCRLRPGITFTYYGLAVDCAARVLRPDGSALGGVFAAGEIMAGSILREGYLAGFGMTIGTVFGRVAGTEAASFVLSA